MLPLCRKKRVRTPTVFQMEATECGAACLGMILEYYGYYEPLGKLRDACGVSRDGSVASLIIKAASLYKLQGKGYKLGIDDLGSMPRPMILFWNFDHYVVYEGRKGDQFYINDPASGPAAVTLSDFEKQYTGVALCFEKTPEFKKHGRRKGIVASLLPKVRGMQKSFLMLIWLGLLAVLPGVIIPALTQVFVDHVMTDNQSWLVPLLLIYGMVVLIQIMIMLLQNNIFRKAELVLTVNSTLTMLRRIFRLPLEFFLTRSTGDIQNRVALNRSVTSTAFGQLGGIMVKLFTAYFFLILMLFYSPLLTAFVAATAILNLALLKYARRSLQLANQNLLVIETRLINYTVNTLDLIESYKAAGREDSVFTNWAALIANYSGKRIAMQKLSAFFSLFPALLLGLNGILILCLGAWLVITGEMTLGGMLGFQILASGFIQPINALVDTSVQIQMLKGNLDRIDDVMQYDESDGFSKNANNTDEKESPGGPLFEMKNISYGYIRTKPPFIKDFNLALREGTRVAIVGASGSGKSTVARIAAGLLAPWSGEILYRNVPVREMTSAQYYQAVSSVDQSIMLFSGTIEENLTLFADHADHRILNQALRDAAIEKELLKRGSALDIQVGESGNNFSGGQRQRLEIARVLALNTPVVILDEATSSLDPVTEQKIDQSLRRKGATCLIIAHRLSTIRDCDEIIVMDQGEIVERGTHDSLMELNGCYRRLITQEGGAV